MAGQVLSRFTPGQLVAARGRDWIVLPDDDPGVVRLRPIDGYDDASVGICPEIEPDAIRQSAYPPPDSASVGDLNGALLLRDAVRLTLRNGAGPFRSAGHLSVSPRPYQFVPLIMALKLDPVRMLIADDVGVGKTIEAGMIARELLDRGAVRRIGVLCPPHLCEQWEEELREKFHIETAVIQSARMARLERQLPRADINVFQHYRHLIASIDYVKGDNYRRMFIDNAPDLLIVDEAHASARPRGDRGASQHQRYELLRDLAKDQSRNILLVTATPHSGIEESFRSLLGLLNPEFDVPEEQRLDRRKLAQCVIQRRRGDLERWMGATTAFPVRRSEERQYTMSAPYLKLYEQVLDFCRESVQADGQGRRQQRVRYWAAIAILRCVLSSPAAAEAVLSNQARRDGGEVVSEDIDSAGDSLFSSQVLDVTGDEQPPDFAPASPVEDSAAADEPQRRKLQALLRDARALGGTKDDRKLSEATQLVADMVRDGFRPIVYCRFIPTANYVAEHLHKHLEREFSGIAVQAVTGEVGDEQRREIVGELGQHERRVLVATDCLSEGINLQQHFDAVVHYDLPWNPNRLEQREGRVDRFGQAKPEVRTVLLYGADNQVDLTVLEVLIRKARTIRQELGIAVPVPVESDDVVQAVVKSVLLNQSPMRAHQLPMSLPDPAVGTFHREWDLAADREKESRGYFSQQQIQPEEVAQELRELEPALGDEQAVQRFLANGVQRFNGELRTTRNSAVFQLLPGDLREGMAKRNPWLEFPLSVSFDSLPHDAALTLGRNHAVVSTLAETVLGAALAPKPDRRFARASAIYTRDVPVRTAALLLRMRYLLEEGGAQQFAEEVVLAPFRRGANGPEWLEPFNETGLRLLEDAKVAANMRDEEKTEHVRWALDYLQDAPAWWAPIRDDRVNELMAAHARLRASLKAKPLAITPHEPPDIIGCYVLVPAGGAR